ncbi:MAG: tRNA (N6-isopentenyl adenosine(37)-C2)-methylthiotransferase MiaB [Thermoleophilia bacterium]
MSEQAHPRNYHLTTFGCQMNEHDSERIRGVLEADGWQPVEDSELADLLVFNTCAVRGSAESRLKGRLGEASRLKRERPDRLVALGGCFAQSRRQEIFTDLPFLDVAFGTQNIGELPALLASAAANSATRGSFLDNPSASADLPGRRLSRHHAWVQVMTGCTNFCSYCIVPFVRGPERSRPQADVVDEVLRLVDDGVVEVTLLGQNVNAYGMDLDHARGAAAFPRLLEGLDGIERLKRLRFMTSHPKDLQDELIRAMRDLPSVCEHLHLPVQSGSSRILSRMKRGYNRERYLELVAALHAAIPDLTLTTDLIVGFPGEQEEDFFRTMTLIEQCRFDGAFTFRYSPRSGTEAATLPGRVPEITVKRRMQELVQLTQQVAREKNAALAGMIQEVMVAGPSRHGEGRCRAHTRGNKVVNFTPVPGARPAAGDILQVRIEDATSMTLAGRMVV